MNRRNSNLGPSTDLLEICTLRSSPYPELFPVVYIERQTWTKKKSGDEVVRHSTTLMPGVHPIEGAFYSSSTPSSSSFYFPLPPFPGPSSTFLRLLVSFDSNHTHIHITSQKSPDFQKETFCFAFVFHAVNSASFRSSNNGSFCWEVLNCNLQHPLKDYDASSW